MSAQRFRLWFRKGERVRYISHLDVLRYWERAFRRAELPLAYSAGFTPHPKLAFAGPLPHGFVSEREVVDVTFDERVDPAEVERRLRNQGSTDLELLELREIAVTLPPPQSAVSWADYRFDVPGLEFAHAKEVLRGLLESETYPALDERREKAREIDLRAGVASARAEQVEGGVRFHVRLGAHQDFTVRPEVFLHALFPGYESPLYVRECLVFDEVSPAREAYRRVGRFQE
jgi:radical SAM-linked protein